MLIKLARQWRAVSFMTDQLCQVMDKNGDLKPGTVFEWDLQCLISNGWIPPTENIEESGFLEVTRWSPIISGLVPTFLESGCLPPSNANPSVSHWTYDIGSALYSRPRL
ncbi:hypothetical protein QAD02_012967 [Eretmocerus hayati]|uniref:Uncharacterized protein n=1 Tax=Eretmocerus hayati TaxID=131215 RepID=A0ACC2P196_9HYME|nr:hypothetical protein QAD02_012967 [Eretmocerus hayati]